MNRKEFISELEFLLSDMPYSEVKEAISYYEGYFDEAGIENESTVVEELGSPEKVASMIKEGFYKTFDEHIEFSEQSAENKYYREVHEVVQAEIVDEKDTTKEKKHSRWKGNADRNRILLIVILVMAVIVCLPLCLGIGGGLLGMFLALFALAIACGLGWIAFLVAAVLLLVHGISIIGSYHAGGLLVFGISLVCIALGLWCMMIAKQFFQLIPIIFEKLVEGTKMLIRKVGE